MKSPRVALIVLDACQTDILLRLADDGRAPTVDRLRSTSAWGPTATSEGLFVGAVFPTLITGCSPATHGRYCFRQLRAGTYEVHPTDPQRTIQRPALWDHLSAAGQRCAVIDLPHTWLSPKINGVQLVDWAAHDANPGFAASDPEFAATIRAFGEHPIGVDCNGHRRTAGDFRLLLDGLLRGVDMRVDLSELVLEREPWDLFATAFSESHCAGHQSWCVHDPSHPRHDPGVRTEVGDVVEQVYEHLDTALGRLLERFDEDTTVFVVASHGMGPHYGGNHLIDEVLRRLDLADRPLSGRAVDAAKRWGRARAPKALRRLRRRMRGGLVSVAGTQRPPDNVPSVIADAANRRYFAVPNNDVYGAIRLNVVGREPSGRVKSADIEATEDRLINALLEIENVDTGEPVVRRVSRTRELFSGDLLGTLPDLLIEWNWTAPISRVASPAIGLVEIEDRDDRTGDHRPGGLLFVQGPNVTPKRIMRAIPTQDIAPTIAAVLGHGMDDVDGEPIPEVASAHAPSP